MLELGARIAIALAGVAAAALNQPKLVPWAAQACALFAAASVLLFLLERRNLRTPTVSSGTALADAAFIASMLAAFGYMDRLGFLALAPVLYAGVQHGANPAMIAPLAAVMIPAAQNLFGFGPITWVIGIQAALVAGMGLLAKQTGKVVTVTKIEQVEKIVESPAEIPADYLEFRENFRALKDHTAALERRSRRDRLGMSLFQSSQSASENPFQALARKLHELTGAEGLTLYTLSQFGDRLVVQSVSGDVPEKVQTASFEVPTHEGEGQIRHRVDKLLLTLRAEDSSVQAGSLVLKAKGRVCGMVSMFHSTPEGLDEALAKADESADALGALVRLQLDRDEEKRRLHEAEILYTVATTSTGSDTPATLAQRVVRELWEVLNVDHLSVCSLDGTDTLLLAGKGASLRALELMSFGYGPGVQGWIKSGSPELAMLDARSDMRLDPTEAIKRRIGSLVVIPIQTADQPEGFLCAMTSRIHGIDAGHLETLRVIGAELSQAMARLRSHQTGEGLATPKELFEAVQEGRGCLVYLEVLRRDELIETYGRAAVAHAVGKFAQRMRARLPQGGLLCRRDEGDYVALLRDADESQASAWANDAMATASMIGLTTPDGRARIPLALRAKTALLDRKVQEILEEKVTA